MAEVRVRLRADNQAGAAVEQLKRQLRTIQNQEVKIDADSSSIDEAAARLKSIGNEEVQITPVIDTAGAHERSQRDCQRGSSNHAGHRHGWCTERS